MDDKVAIRFGYILLAETKLYIVDFFSNFLLFYWFVNTDLN